MAGPLAGLTFDQVEPNYEFITSSRSITAEDVAEFVRLTGDDTLHTGDEYGGDINRGAPIVHGALVLAMVVGMVKMTGLFEGDVIAFLETAARFIRTVKFNDVLNATGRILEKKRTSRSDRGIVVIGVTVCNQHLEPVMDCSWTMLVRKGPPPPGRDG